ncbi:hypothetical protein HMPREF9555_02179 [Selenomonas artemidis F0399]|uniref:Uncharacterized protein n=1 Tax=Selenomonas artemidis F0399 TaxID=749551 RepID=E7N584_9FIRM|nr:hypothetical protein HMPREF9555_02179 [Selenomonas artemidis F0399]
MAHSCVIFVKRFVDVGLIYAFLAFSSIPCSASKLPRHLLYGLICGILAYSGVISYGDSLCRPKSFEGSAARRLPQPFLSPAFLARQMPSGAAAGQIDVDIIHRILRIKENHK